MKVYDDVAIANRSDSKMNDQGCLAIYLWDLLKLRSGGVVVYLWLPVAEIASKS